MENHQNSKNQNQRELSLEQRISELETRLDQALMIIADTYRYGKLRDLLAEGKWEEADRETTKVMVEISGKETIEQIKPEDIQKFPCNALTLIDNLWKKYSNNHFGFSVQLDIYQSVGGNMSTIRSQQNQYLKMTIEKIGWQKDDQPVKRDDYNFCLEAPEGGLPAHWWDSPYGAKMANFFLARLIACDL